MNITFACIARTTPAKQLLPRLFEAVVEDAQRIYGEAKDHHYLDENMAMFNADRMSGAWKPATWHESEGHIFAVSQPPVPVDVDSSEDSYWQTVAPLIINGQQSRLLPNHSGMHRRPDGSVQIWTDSLGLGRCYYVITPHYVAASNHIGILTYFLDGPVEPDLKAIGRYIHAGWFTGDDSPIQGIHRLRESATINISTTGEVVMGEHTDLSLLVGKRDVRPDFDEVVDQTSRIARNLDKLSVRTSSIYLSGGRDSRMTASVWLSGGGDAKVVTLGTLQDEADIAQELMSQFEPDHANNQVVRHVITYPNPVSITMGLEERFKNAFDMWDGDAAPSNVRPNVRIPEGRSGLSIGGVGGEIMHGYYYQRPGDADRIAKLENPVDYAAKSFRNPFATSEAAGAMDGFFDQNYLLARKRGLDDMGSLDYLYLVEKFRRWGNQALGSMAAIMLSGPAYVRACFDLTPQDKVDKVFPDEIVRRALPTWSDVRYYKANSADSKKSMKKKLATFDTDPDYFYDVFKNPRLWPQFFQEDQIDKLLELVRAEEALPVHESRLNYAMWIDHIGTHVNQLNRRVAEVRAR